MAFEKLALIQKLHNFLVTKELMSSNILCKISIYNIKFNFVVIVNRVMPLSIFISDIFVALSETDKESIVSKDSPISREKGRDRTSELVMYYRAKSQSEIRDIPS